MGDSDGNIHVVPDWRCYTLLELNPDGLVYYYYDDTWTPNGHYGRRALMEEAGIPLVDEILNWEVEHWMKREGFHQDGDDEDTPDTDVGNTDTETATDDRRVLSAVNRLLKA